LSAIPAALAVIRCGRFSLQVFSLGALLAALTVVSWLMSGNNMLVQTLMCVVGVALQFVYAAFKDKRREDRAAVLPVPVSEPVPVRSKSQP
jgi:hypothetical protein